MKHTGRMLSVIAAVLASILAVTNSASASPGTVTHAEYRRVDLGDSTMARVHRIFDTKGVRTESLPVGTYIEYHIPDDGDGDPFTNPPAVIDRVITGPQQTRRYINRCVGGSKYVYVTYIQDATRGLKWFATSKDAYFPEEYRHTYDGQTVGYSCTRGEYKTG